MNFNPMDLMKNAQKIQEQMGSFQEKLSAINATGSAGGGMVEIDLNGKFEVLAARIAPEIAGDGDVEMLQDLIVAAFSNGYDKIRAEMTRELGAMAGGMGVPGLAGMMGLA